VIKIVSTTLGETGADMFSMTFNLGYWSTIVIFMSLFLILLVTKLSLKGYHPLVYWLTFTASAIAGTAISDFIDRTLGFGYALGSAILIIILLIILVLTSDNNTNKQPEIMQLKARVGSNYFGINIYNDSEETWSDCKTYLNDKYKAMLKISPGKNFFPYSYFIDNDSRKFDYNIFKPTSFYIKCQTPSGDYAADWK